MRGLFVVLTGAALLALAPATAVANKHGNHGHHGDHGHHGNLRSGAVYTQTNDPAGNSVVVYKRKANGTITERARVSTGGLGAGSTPPFGFPIVDSQGSVELTKDGNVLFAVNAGDDTISSFKVGKRGGLKLVDHKSSGGDLPISVDSRGHLLYVVNSLSGDISGFRFKRNGHFSAIPGSTESLSTAGPGGVPAQIGFAPRYRVLTVTLRGTQTIDTFKLGSDDTPGPAKANHSPDMNPFGFAYRHDGTAIVSNAGDTGNPPNPMDPTKFLGRASSFGLASDGTLTPIDSVDAGGRATCWVVLTPNSRYAFMTNTLSQSVSRFRISSDGHLTLLGTTPTGPGFASDEALSKGGRYLYVVVPSIMGGMSHIDYYKTGPGGSLTQIGSTASNLPPGASGAAAR